MCAADISKSFLQGVTYEELSRITGEPVREVNFTLPRYCVDMLPQIEGFETFNPDKKVLHCDKPGTGSVDAPRAFSIESQGALTSLGMKASAVDPELWFMHVDGKLSSIMTKHVDYLKAAGPADTSVRVYAGIQKVSGEM